MARQTYEHVDENGSRKIVTFCDMCEAAAKGPVRATLWGRYFCALCELKVRRWRMWA